MSKRRQAEIDVIEAADEFVAGLERRLGWLGQETLQDVLKDAVLILRMTPLDEPSSAFRNATETGDESAELSKLGAKSDAMRVLQQIVARPMITCDRIEELLGRTHQSVSARVHDLWRKGWIEDSGVRRKTRSGRNAIAWMVSERGRHQYWADRNAEG